jgi:NitT/TauT family transport system substrate-binding protein
VPLRVAIPDMVSPSYFPAIAAVELGFFAREGLDATVELIFPVTKTYEELREGRIAFVGGAAHAALYAFPGWRGCKLLCALSQNMYWFLVVRKELGAARGDLGAVKGLRIGAAPGPVDGLKRMLAVSGIDPEREAKIGPVPGSAGSGVSFGMAAAKALEDGAIDAFWANGMAAEVAVRRGAGSLVVDARRGDGPRGSQHYTFAALVSSEEGVAGSPEEAAAAVRAVVGAQGALKADSSLASRAARKLFPRAELALIDELVRRDAPYYDASISPASVRSLNGFAMDIGLLSKEPAYEEIVAARLRA